jgi:hypothetical protein
VRASFALPGPSLQGLRAGLRVVIMCLKVCIHFSLMYRGFEERGCELNNLLTRGKFRELYWEFGVNVGEPLGQPTIPASP